MLTAKVLLVGLILYAIVGTMFAGAFVARGVQRVDRAAAGASWAFRALIVPGAVAFWPWLAVRWAMACEEPLS